MQSTTLQASYPTVWLHYLECRIEVVQTIHVNQWRQEQTFFNDDLHGIKSSTQSISFPANLFMIEWRATPALDNICPGSAT